MATINAFISGMGETATLHTRVEGGRDPVTQWPALTWTDSTIKIFVNEIQTREVDSVDAGRITEKVLRAFIRGDQDIAHLDKVTYHGELYEVESEPTVSQLLGDAVFKKFNLVMVMA